MQTIRWGIIGVGNVCEVKSGPGLQKATNSELVAVMRRTGHLAADYARRHGVARWYDDADALIHDPQVDAVYIATPPASHLEYTLRAAKAGKPVYVEKPMARTHDECQQMIGACRSAGVPLFVAYYRRRLPRFLKVVDLITSGAIGAVRAVRVTLTQPLPDRPDPGNLEWRFLPEIAGAGLFLDVGSHMLDWLDYALGPIGEAQGFAANQGGVYPAEDIVTGTWVHESGVQGVGLWGFATHDRQDEIAIYGAKGQVVFECYSTRPIHLITAAGAQEFAIDNPPHIQQPLIQTIVDELNGSGTCPSTGETAARTTRVMDAMLAGWRARA